MFDGEKFRVTFTLTSHWNDGYNAKIKLENTGDSIIENWKLGFDYKNKITNIWNAEIFEDNEKGYIVKNVGWNQDIVAGGNIEFGISGDQAFTGFPEIYELIGTSTEINKEDYTIEYNVKSDWETGFYGSISITNNTNTVLEDWVLEFDFDREITEIWNGIIKSHEGNHYVTINAKYNSSIAPGESVSIGIKGCNGETGNEPSGYVLYSFNNNVQSDDLNNNGIPDDFEDMFNWYLMDDTDEDGLPDDIEIWLGSNPDKEDTDEDGLTDYYEMFITYTDLLLKDSDNNGIIDGNDDLDGDGISNMEEGFLSHPLYSDTDGDNINDFDERNIYMTDANMKDTDKDGAEDKWEIENGYDPLVYNSSFDIYKEAEGDNITASVKINVLGTAVNSLVVEPVEDMILLDNTIPGYIGSPFNFEIDGSFNTAEITFEFDESYLEDENFVPTIYYFNEETQLLEEINTTVEGNKASAFTTHFSRYILLNKITYEKCWNVIKEPSDANINEINIGFVVDTSGSMSGTKITTAKKVVQNFINKLRTSDTKTNVSLVSFSSDATIVSELTDDYNTFLTKLNTLKSGGYTSIYKGLGKSLDILTKYDNKDLSYNAIILLTDGYDEPSTTYNVYSEYVDKAIEKGIDIYTVGIGTINEELLIKIADYTGGKYFYASDASNLYEIYGEIQTEIMDYTTDSNEDGISDYYTKLLCEGQLRIGTQKDMFKGISYKDFNANNDYDGDGLINGEEIKIRREKITGRVYAYVYSNPFLRDTDGDGVNDLIDDNPLDSFKGFTIYETEKSDQDLKSYSHDQRPEDFQYSDKSIDQLRDMKYISWNDFIGLEANDYVYNWKSLVKATSMGEMQVVALDMVNHFMDGTATDYWNQTLIDNMEAHDSSTEYISGVTDIINSYIEENDGDISGLVYDVNKRGDSYLVDKMDEKKLYQPVYNDKFSGLGICVDGLYGNEIEIVSYKLEGNTYQYTVRFTLYDIYGLDSEDIEEKKMINDKMGFGVLNGFRGWYILQHCNLYSGDYQPYITYAQFERTVKGTIK